MKTFEGVPVIYPGDPDKLKRLETCKRILQFQNNANIRVSEQVVDKLLEILEPECARIDRLLEQVERDGWTY